MMEPSRELPPASVMLTGGGDHLINRQLHNLNYSLGTFDTESQT